MATSERNLNISSVTDLNNAGTRIRIRVLDQVPACPPIRSTAMLSPEFQQLQGHASCLRSVASYEPIYDINQGLETTFEFVSVCCYNDIG